MSKTFWMVFLALLIGFGVFADDRDDVAVTITGPTTLDVGDEGVYWIAEDPLWGGYNWSISGGSYTIISQNKMSIKIKFLSGGSFTVRYQYNQFGQWKNSTLNVTVLTPFPAPPVITKNPDPCNGEVALTATSAPSGFTYHWKRNGSYVASANPYITNQPGTYTCQFKRNADQQIGALSNSLIVPIQDFDNPSPEVNYSPGEQWEMCYNCPNPVAELTNASEFDSYQWLKSGNTISGATGSSYKITAPGYYHVVATNNCGTQGSYQIHVIAEDVNYITNKLVKVQGARTLEDVGQLEVLEGEIDITTNYFDGLGRPIQINKKQASPNGFDLVTPIAYDEYGRESIKYLPYTTDNAGAFNFGAPTDQTNYYAGAEGSFDQYARTSYPFSETEFEASPLNRAVEVGAPGEPWQIKRDGQGKPLSDNNTIKESRRFNNIGEVLYLEVDASGDLVSHTSEYYPESQLYVVTQTDENGNQKKTYANKQEAVLVNASQIDANEYTQTYSVYDDLGRLRYVVQPEGMRIIQDKVDAAQPWTLVDIEGLYFYYEYDARGNVVTKHIPGAEDVYLLYDNRDRLVLSQDGNQRLKDQWTFTKYDRFSRVVMTGLYHNALTKAQLSTQLKDWATLYEVQNPDETHYYTNAAFPVWDAEQDQVLTVSYYDDYDFNADGSPDVEYDAQLDFSLDTAPITFDRVQGKVTGTKTLVLGSDPATYLEAHTFYDERQREVQTKATNFGSNYDLASMQYNFAGLLQKSALRHHNEETTVTVVETNEYDAQDRLVETSQKIDDQPEAILAKMVYNPLGDLLEKKVGVNGMGQALQTVDYTYNVRGWLTQINDPSSLGDDLFAFGIHYQNPSHGGMPLYNGNIAETEWRTANDDQLRWYRYGYDAFARITSATDNTMDQRYSLAQVSYDHNGNILNLVRNGHLDNNATTFGVMDNLTYGYTGNQLITVEDAGSATQGFVDGVHLPEEYTYDANGNMTADINKGIAQINYNHLNLPEEVIFEEGGKSIKYVYDANGIKKRKEVYTNAVLQKTTEYYNDFIYENGALQFFKQAEGYVEPDGMGGYDMVYQYSDVWNNVRLSYADMDGDGIIDANTEINQERNYYPFGLEHKGYNTVVNNAEYNHQTYQDQELDKETGWLQFKWRNHQADLGRFFNVDPLAEDYAYNSSYAFQENKLGSGIELEGLELKGWGGHPLYMVAECFRQILSATNPAKNLKGSIKHKNGTKVTTSKTKVGSKTTSSYVDTGTETVYFIDLGNIFDLNYWNGTGGSLWGSYTKDYAKSGVKDEIKTKVGKNEISQFTKTETDLNTGIVTTTAGGKVKKGVSSVEGSAGIKTDGTINVNGEVNALDVDGKAGGFTIGIFGSGEYKDQKLTIVFGGKGKVTFKVGPRVEVYHETKAQVGND